MRQWDDTWYDYRAEVQDIKGKMLAGRDVLHTGWNKEACEYIFETSVFARHLFTSILQEDLVDHGFPPGCMHTALNLHY